ncbi:MAG: cell division transport system ATP-binding protein [Parasphingorhabdus sp.]|jgi:cell division transport system ATP-binding protein
MIRFSQVSKRYGSGPAVLSAVTFHLAEGEMAFLTGHSGAGKSTLLKLILLSERPDSGQVVVGGMNLGKLGRRKIPELRRAIGAVFQDNKLLSDRTVRDNVALPLVVSGLGHRECQRRARAALDKVGLLNKENQFPPTLSGGEQQRVGIARAVVNRPTILLADEPTGNLDAAMAEEIMDLFREFNQHQVTVLLATHDLERIAKYPTAKRLRLEQGKLVSVRV